MGNEEGNCPILELFVFSKVKNLVLRNPKNNFINCELHGSPR
jgi:hypothetical protein